MFDDEMLLSGKSGKKNLLKTIWINNLYGEVDSSLIVSEILTKATDTKELALDKMNASINTLGMCHIYCNGR